MLAAKRAGIAVRSGSRMARAWREQAPTWSRAKWGRVAVLRDRVEGGQDGALRTFENCTIVVEYPDRGEEKGCHEERED